MDVPPVRYEEAFNLVKNLQGNAIKEYPYFENTHGVSEKELTLVLNRTWLPQLTITGVSGLPPAENAGNVMLPECAFKLSLRCPPTLDTKKKAEELTELLTSNPPYGATVSFENVQTGLGWNCPEYSEWLNSALKESAKEYFGKELQGQG